MLGTLPAMIDWFRSFANAVWSFFDCLPRGKMPILVARNIDTNTVNKLSVDPLSAKRQLSRKWFMPFPGHFCLLPAQRRISETLLGMDLADTLYTQKKLQVLGMLGDSEFK